METLTLSLQVEYLDNVPNLLRWVRFPHPILDDVQFGVPSTIETHTDIEVIMTHLQYLKLRFYERKTCFDYVVLLLLGTQCFTHFVCFFRTIAFTPTLGTPSWSRPFRLPTPKFDLDLPTHLQSI